MKNAEVSYLRVFTVHWNVDHNGLCPMTYERHLENPALPGSGPCERVTVSLPAQMVAIDLASETWGRQGCKESAIFLRQLAFGCH